VDNHKKSAHHHVQCPLCGTTVPEVNINFHLDKCIVARASKESEQEHLKSQQKDETNKVDDEPKRTHLKSFETTRKEHPITPSPVNNVRPRSTQLTQGGDEETKTTGVGASRNAFSHLMEKSQKVFAGRRREWLHLDDEAKVVSFRSSGETSHQQQQPKSMIWSTTVLMEKKQVELTVSTSVVPTEESAQKRWVRYPSRLSVPVLKSVLQKSIRRRKPLPSVRVAMELADKARSELFRRLPIIVLEDSTLHPELPLLVWLMVADSRSYIVPDTLMRRVFAIIYQVASCPWTDCVPRDFISSEGKINNNNSNKVQKTPKAAMSDNGSSSSEDDEALLLLSMHVRAQYGGMACDMKMLSLYMDWWRYRFQDLRVVDKTTTNRLMGLDDGKNNADIMVVRWNQVPHLIHQKKSTEQGKNNTQLASLLDQGLPFLQLKDISVEGVDFHCSPVLDKVLEDTSLVREMLDWLQRHNRQVPNTTTAEQRQQQREYLLHILKGCMWSFSSGVNHRRPLLEREQASAKRENQDELKELWNELVVPKARSFMSSFIRQRLHTR